MERSIVAQESLAIAVDCDRSVNFAMQQNDVPIMRQVRVTNASDQPLSDVQVRISSELGLFPDWQTTISTIPAGGTYTLGPCDLRFSAQMLMSLTERIKGAIRIQVLKGDHTLAEAVEPLDMLAFDEWSGLSYSLPELLAAFVTPNHPIVASILSDAAQWLGDNTGDSSLSGYQSRSPKRVAQITQAIFKAVQGRGINYCSPPASFEMTGQRIRLPDRVCEEKLGTCLDLAVLLATCLEQSGLFPLIVLLRGHALVGVWLNEECFSDCATDDVAYLRKRVDLNEILVFESTVLTSPPPNDFSVAVSAGRNHLDDQSAFQCAIDIHRCRKSRVRPLPVRKADGTTVTADTVVGPTGPETLFDIGAASVPFAQSGTQETPTSRLDRWKRKLLDLTLHNKLINFKQSKKTIPLLCPSVAALEDALADGQEFHILPYPSEFGSQTLRSAELHRLRTGTDALSQLLQSQFDNRRLHANLDADELRSRVTGVYRAARTAMEEGGVSALYLAAGFLAWYESETSEQCRMAPLILIPVEVRRHSVQEGYRICQSDEEPRLNVTMLEKLSKDFGLKVPSMDPLPEDNNGIDLQGIFTTFRHVIKDMRRWDVLEEAHIGFFSFTKFLMWRDLEQRTADLLKNRVVDHLVNHPNEPFSDDGGFPRETELDTSYRLHETFCPVSADSSQLAAVYAASNEKSFVLFGPPGTGKSQTITNLISQCLANGKSVLFVSEKMAALNVVFTRLARVGLGPFCLELHSNKAQKRHVIDQLGQAIDVHAERTPEEWEREAQRLTGLRAELNEYVLALHKPRSFGYSVFQATSRLIGLRSVSCIDLGFSAPGSITRDLVDRWHELIERARVAGDICGHPSGNPWSCCGIEQWSGSLLRDLEADILHLQESCDRLEGYVRQLGPRLAFGTAWNLSYFDFADKFIRFLQESPRPPAQLLTEVDWTTVEALLTTWVAHGRTRDTARLNLLERHSETILSLDLDGLSAQLTKARASWLLPRFFGVRGVRKVLAMSLLKQERLDADALAKDIALATTVRTEDRYLGDAGGRALQLLGTFWKDGAADWDEVDRLRDWSGRFRHFLQVASGGDSTKASGLRQRWVALICDGHDGLQPSGDLGQIMARFLADYQEFLTIKGSLEQRLGCSPAVWAAESKRATLADIRLLLSKWKVNLPGLRAWCNWRSVRQECIQAGLGKLITIYEEGSTRTSELRNTFDRSFYQWWVEATTEGDLLLQRFFSPEHERKIAQFRELDERFAQLTRTALKARLSARVPSASGRVSDSSEVGILQRQRQLRRGHLPVRRLFQRVPNLLSRIKPCLLMSPISVAQYLDSSHPPFDLIVFDEASQIPVWDAVGAIARGREVIVVGDPKQLPPTNFFQRADEQDENEEVVAEELESVLDECLSAQLPQMNLRWHYRSKHESLIAFSNYHYYGNDLLTFPSPHLDKGVSYRYVSNGIYDRGKSRTNRIEAQAVVAEVVQRLRDPERSRLSIGIVTFSQAQQVLIEDLLDDARQTHPVIEPFFGDAVDEPVFIKNLENVQGDERDVILFSICYGPDSSGRPPSMNFGPLNRDGGERRLNVAVTRARAEVVVFASIKADHIDLSRTRMRGAQDLKCFLDYADRGREAIAQALIPNSGDEFESPFERDVCERIRALGYDVHTQVGCSGYRIDLAVVDPEVQGRYLLGIECDGANYHSAKTARDRDRLRENVLRGLGWKLHRVWSSDWWVSPDECVAKIQAALDNAKTHRNATPPPAEPEPEPAAPEPKVAPVSAPKVFPAAPLEVQPYQSYPIRKGVRDPQDFYSPSSNAAIRKLIEQIVEQEGPVHLEVVARRVALHWGLTRLGPIIRDRIEQIVDRAGVKRVTEGKAVFLWGIEAEPAKYASFRPQGVRQEDQRDIDEIPREEIIAALQHVLKQQISLPMPDLIRETAMVFGFQRAGQTIQRVIGSAIQTGTERGLVIEDINGRVRLSQDH